MRQNREGISNTPDFTEFGGNIIICSITGLTEGKHCLLEFVYFLSRVTAGLHVPTARLLCAIPISPDFLGMSSPPLPSSTQTGRQGPLSSWCVALRDLNIEPGSKHAELQTCTVLYFSSVQVRSWFTYCKTYISIKSD